MSLLLLHLSDIHILDAHDPILRRADKIAAATYPHLPVASVVAVIISGDIAQSGQTQEYELAKTFFADIRNHIISQKNIEVHFIIAPGNHDCNFTGDQEARNTLVVNISKKGPEVPQSYINIMTSVQADFNAFKGGMSAPAVIGDELWQVYEIKVGSKTVLIDTLNASWTSTRHEQQGGLYFPFEKYQNREVEESKPDLRLAVLHHPFSWYSQVNVQRFRSFVHSLTDMIFTGHEHYANARQADEAWSGSCTYIDGAVLQERSDSTISGFNLVLIDIDSRKYKFETYALKDGRYSHSRTNSSWEDYRNMVKVSLSVLPLTDDWEKCLVDPGATLKHPSNHPVTLQDIYVYPDMDSRLQQAEKPGKNSSGKTSSKILLNLKNIKNDVLIEGAETAGKTRLLYMLYLRAHADSLLPLFIKGSNIKSGTHAEIRKLIRGAVNTQYGSSACEQFEQASLDKKILYLDDLDGSPLNKSSCTAAFTNLRAYFARAIITVGENYKLAELFGNQAADLEEQKDERVSPPDHYKLSPLGYQRRAEMVEKWNSIGANGTENNDELLASCDEAEKLIESARIQHVASTVPIFVLSLLQAAASGATKELLKSSFAHYYYFLIVGAFEKGGVKPNEIDAYLAAATHLSWFVKTNTEDQRISQGQFDTFVKEYSSEWTETDHGQLLDVLINSRLIERDGDALYFTYPYAYYYFLGRFASISERADVQEYIIFCMRNLYVRDCANTILFLAHHTSNSKVLDHVVESLNGHFKDYEPVTLSKVDVKSVANLISQAPEIRFKAQNPREFRKKQALTRDARDNGSDNLSNQPNGGDEPRNEFQELISLFKSSEVAGALLTHQYPNYSRAKKVAAIKAVFDSSLRAIRMFFDYFETNTAELTNALKFKFKNTDSELSKEEAEGVTRVAIGLLLRFISTVFVMKAGVHLSSKEIASNISEVMGTNPSCAYRLIKISQDLQRPGRLPRLEIGRLIRDESDNVCVMGVLQLLITHRMYMFDTDFDDKDWALSSFKLGGHDKALELKHQKRPGQHRWG